MSMSAYAALTPDVSFTPTEEEAAMFTIADNNHDSVSWGLYNDSKTNHQNVFNSNTDLTGKGSSEIPYDDWLFFPAIEFTDANSLYELKFDAARGTFSSYYGLDEVFEVKLGTAPNAQAMTQQVMGDTHLTKENNKDGKFKTFSEMFNVPAAGTYYIGIHIFSSNSKSIGIYMANFSITKQQSTTSAPTAVESLTATPGRNGDLNATLMFYMPDKDINGNALAADTEIRVVAASSVDSKETTGKPGALCTISELGTVQGINDITVTTYVGEDGGKSATVQIYTGVSIPGAITNTRCEASDDDMTLTFKWDAPTRTADGNGFVKNTGNTYIIYEELMNNIMGMDTYYWNQVCELPLDQTWYEYKMPADGIQRKIKIGVIAKNAAGSNNQVVTPICGLGGKPYALPMIEDFTGCSLTEFNYNPITNWEAAPEYYGQTWVVNDPYIIDPKYNISHKAVLIFSNHIGTRARVSIPKFSTLGATSPSAKFAIYMGDDTPNMSVWAMTPASGDWFKVSDIAINRSAKNYRVVDVPLGEACADQPWVLLAVDGYFDPSDYQIGFISEYSIVNSLPVDIGVLSLETESVIVGETVKYSAYVYNPGRENATITNISWKVEGANGVLASSDVAVNDVMQPETMDEYSWEFTPTADMIGAATVSFELTVTDDGDLDNNVATGATMIKSGAKVTVRDLAAEEVTEGIKLTWTEPSGNMYTEGFESETAYQRTGTIAGFTNVDGDAYQVWNLGEKDPMGAAPRAWSVWDNAWCMQAFGNAYLADSGNQFLLVTCPGDELAIPPSADDWLISPEVNGLSYIAFKARVLSEMYGSEYVEILYSSTTADRAEFKLLEKMTIPVTMAVGNDGLDHIIYCLYSSELPADAKYFAIRYTSHDVFGIMLDELEYAPASADNGITGYDIYRDGNVVAANVAAKGEYIDKDGADGYSHSYAVLPITAGDKGGLSNVVRTDGISGVVAPGTFLKVSGGMGEILVSCTGETIADVYRLDGACIASATVAGAATIPAAQGIYIVKAGTAAYKVVVR